ncbi:DUF402 domain-containing protein [Bacillus salacetis]|uniref:DUF402 domain-containing protein n=1 Tax=Bacillus salacetis TaxID=2315464 RepID=UPI003BA09F92
MKRKYGNRSGWKRVIDRKYAQTYLDTKSFTGYITLLNTVKVTDPLTVRYGGRKVCIVDDGYMWLHQFPTGQHHAVTTMFDAKGDIMQWYIDICFKNSVENGIPCMHDLYLDLIVLPSGEVIEKDVDELEEAFSAGIIDKHLYDLAWAEQKNLLNLIRSGNFDLMKLSQQHKGLLAKDLS